MTSCLFTWMETFQKGDRSCACEVRLYKVVLLFCCHPGVRVHLQIRCLAMSLSGSHCGWVDERLAI